MIKLYPVISATETHTDLTTCMPVNGTIDLTPAGGSTLGYTYSWTGPGGFTATTQDLSALAAGNYSVTIGDVNLNAVCNLSFAPITINIATPSVTVGSIPGVCSGTTTSSLTWLATSGGPLDQYRIDWDNASNLAGLADFGSIALPASPITISGIPLAAATYNGLFYAKNSVSTCETSGMPISVTVSPNNTITLSSAAGTNSQTRCINTAITDINYATTVATGATFSGLPAGVTGTPIDNHIRRRLSATPAWSPNCKAIATL